jgi:hypothetical protein
MPAYPSRGPSRDPLRLLAESPFCDFPENPDHPDTRDLTPEQQAALHEWYHEVLAAGYRLYQKIPPARAAIVMRKKLGLIFKHDGSRGSPSSRLGG